MAVRKRTFDQCFSTFPALTHPSNLNERWEGELRKLEEDPLEGVQKLMLTRSLGRVAHYEVGFHGAGKENLRGILSIPRKRGKVPAIITFHDYRSVPPSYPEILEGGAAHLAIILRHHRGTPKIKNQSSDLNQTHVLHHGLDTIEGSYVYLTYLDALRAVEFLLEQKGIHPKKIGLLGCGFGAAMATFAAFHKRDHVGALALLRPEFLWLPGWLEESNSLLAEEMRILLKGAPSTRRTQLKKGLAYLDPIHYSEELPMPVFVAAALEDEVVPPGPIFAFFHHLLTEKVMELYPDKNQSALSRDATRKAIHFLLENL